MEQPIKFVPYYCEQFGGWAVAKIVGNNEPQHWMGGIYTEEEADNQANRLSSKFSYASTKLEDSSDVCGEDQTLISKLDVLRNKNIEISSAYRTKEDQKHILSTRGGYRDHG